MCNVVSNIHDQSFVSILWGRWTNDHPQHNQIWLKVKDKSRKFFKLHGGHVGYKNLCSKYDKIHFFPSKCGNLGLFKKILWIICNLFIICHQVVKFCPPKKPCQWPSSKAPCIPPHASVRLSHHPTHMMNSNVNTKVNEPSMIYCLIF
jgi:hypothetical protein